MARNMNWSKLEEKNKKENLISIVDQDTKDHFGNYYMAACPTYGCSNRRNIHEPVCSVCSSFNKSISKYKELLSTR